jgi:hypothetical protein
MSLYCNLKTNLLLVGPDNRSQPSSPIANLCAGCAPSVALISETAPPGCCHLAGCAAQSLSSPEMSSVFIHPDRQHRHQPGSSRPAAAPAQRNDRPAAGRREPSPRRGGPPPARREPSPRRRPVVQRPPPRKDVPKPAPAAIDREKVS